MSMTESAPPQPSAARSPSGWVSPTTLTRCPVKGPGGVAVLTIPAVFLADALHTPCRRGDPRDR